MNAVEKSNDKAQREAYSDLLVFMSDFSNLLAKHIDGVRRVLLITVDQAMKGVSAINDAVEVNVSQAEPSRSFDHAALRLGDFNRALASQKDELSQLDEQVRGSLHAIIGGLSVDDVVKQRLEHLSLSIRILADGIHKFIHEYQEGRTPSDEFVEQLQRQMLSAMFSSFTMEDEKQHFRRAFGLIEGINQKSL